MAKTINKERNERVDKESIDILKYEPLIWKVVTSFAKRLGNWVYDFKEDLKQIGFLALMSAFKDYDNERGTYVTLAFLRVQTFIGRYLRKQAVSHSHCGHLEDLLDSRKAIAWQDLFPSNDIDLNVIARLAVRDAKDWQVLEALVDDEPYKTFPARVGLTRKDATARIKELRENLIAVTNEIYEGDLT